MSSEMRELIAKWRAVAEKQRGMASRDNERGDLECAARMAGMAERTEYMADELEALLARTEAGADRPVAEISELSGAKLIVLYSADEIGHLPKGTKLYTHPQDASGDAVPCDNDGKEQDAFEAWAKAEGFDMVQHPLHWLFLNERTNAARKGWRGALAYVSAAMQAKEAK